MNSSALSRGIVVGDSKSLHQQIERLSEGAGGVILLKPSAVPYRVEIADPGDRRQDAPVEIRSLDPDRPAVIEQFMATNREALTITDVVMRQVGDLEDYTRSPFLLHVRGCEDVTLSGVTFEGSADGALGIPGSGARQAINFANFRDSDGVRVEDSTVTGFHHGVTMVDASDIAFVGNDVSRLTGDGVRIGGAQDVQIEGNLSATSSAAPPASRTPT